ncbi:MAG TPA: SAM-dependent methyltransferase [Burkholderiales bacterium]|nr:SAM-dependent methyltransferase [Burkholderiales bacterium]
MPPPFVPRAEAQNRNLATLIRGEIAEAGGWISFSRYMELALYHPRLGYYRARRPKFGVGGDFVTAPEVSSLFGRTLARQVARVLELTGGDVLELGAGSGKLALDLIRELDGLNAAPSRYFILELSAELATQQLELLSSQSGDTKVEWLSRLPETFTGIVLANEVLDALPVNVVAWRREGLFERGVAVSPEGEFEWRERTLTDPELARAAVSLDLEPEYVSEIGLRARALTRALSAMLQRGALILIDYGFGQREYYHPQRSRGTLMCHYRHRAHEDPFYLPGLQDITSHVDFSAIAEAGIDSGLALLGYTTQAQFLVNCGITRLLEQTPPDNIREYLPLATAVHKLVSPAEMGELIKVIALGRGIEGPLLGFAQGEKSRLL